MNNISIIVENDLCDGCCECISACSANNIYILMNISAGHPVPFVAVDDCNHCGSCFDACHNKERLPVSQSISQAVAVMN